MIRHRKENLNKCSLRGLERREDFQFLSYPNTVLPDLNGYILLSMDAPHELSLQDASCGILLLDATWRYATRMAATLSPLSTLSQRSLPKFCRTAYPRYQTGCPNPEMGLASIEALAIAYAILKKPLIGLCDHYHWKEAFFQKNAMLFSQYGTFDV